LSLRILSEYGTLYNTHCETSFGAVLPQKTYVRRVDARSNKLVEILVINVPHLQRTKNDVVSQMSRAHARLNHNITK